MSEKYKILAGMLSLRRFTAEDLARFSEANLNTVKSEISRWRHLLDDAPAVAGQKSQGGQRLAYVLAPEKAAGVRAELKSMFAKLQQAVGDLPAEPVTVDDVRPPMALLAAEDTLRRAQDETDPNRDHWLEQTALHLQATRQELKAMSVNPARRGHEEILAPRVRVVELEMKLLNLKQPAFAVPEAVAANPVPAGASAAHLMCFFDAADAEWTHSLKESLEPLAAEFSYTNATDDVPDMLQRMARQGLAGPCLVTMDSKKKNVAYWKLAEDLMASCLPSQRLLFLDGGFDPDFRKHVMVHGMSYCGRAADLGAGEIRGVIERERVQALWAAKALVAVWGTYETQPSPAFTCCLTEKWQNWSKTGHNRGN